MNTKNYPSTHHSFDIDIATQLKSVDLAILVAHFSYWVKFNAKMKKNFHQGKYWTYQTQKEIMAHFPYWSRQNIRKLIKKLECLGILIKGDFNKRKMDKTIWYTLSDEICQKMFTMVDSNHSMVDSNQAIPHTKTQDTTTIVCSEPAPVAPLAKENLSVEVVHNSLPQEQEKEIQQAEKPTPSAVDLDQQITRCVKTHPNGSNFELSIQDVFTFAVQKKMNWRAEEISQAWDVLVAYKGPIRDAYRFIEGTIKNIRNSANSETITRKTQDKKCQKEKSYTKDKSIAPKKESSDNAMSEQRWLEQLSQLGLRTK